MQANSLPLIKDLNPAPPSHLALPLLNRTELMADHLWLDTTVCHALPEIGQIALDFIGSRFLLVSRTVNVRQPLSPEMSDLLIQRRNEELVCPYLIIILNYINIRHYKQFAIRIMAGNPSLSLPPPIINCLLYMAGLLPEDPIYNPLQEHTPHCREFRDCQLEWWNIEDHVHLQTFQYSLSDFESGMKHFMHMVKCYLLLLCCQLISASVKSHCSWSSHKIISTVY